MLSKQVCRFCFKREAGWEWDASYELSWNEGHRVFCVIQKRFIHIKNTPTGWCPYQLEHIIGAQYG